MPRPATAVFTPPRRWLLRRQVPRTENVVSLALLAGAVALVAWVWAQRDAFDPSRRDLAPEAQSALVGETVLYQRPLRPWVEPGSSAGEARLTLGAFPPSVADGAWRPGRSARRFTAENLYEKINGEAEKFLRQGFVAMDYLVLRSPDAELAIELYDQGETGGAMGIFADHLAGDRAPEERGGVVYFTTSAGVIGRAGRYFFRAAGDGDEAALRAKSDQLVDALAMLAESHDDLPVAQAVLAEGLGLPDERISFEQANVFQLDFATAFWFGVETPGSDARVFVHEAATPAAAVDLYAALVEEQSYDYEVRLHGESNAVLWHDYLKTFFALSRRGRFVFGVDNVPDEDGIGPAMGRLEAALDAVGAGSQDGVGETPG